MNAVTFKYNTCYCNIHNGDAFIWKSSLIVWFIVKLVIRTFRMEIPSFRSFL